jgi:CheY-like chemotaxis protein
MTTVIPNPITPKVVSRMTPALVAGGRKRILLVDANTTSQTRRAGMLRQRGVEVTCAHDMANAKRLWHADPYHLVILDATDVHDDAVAFCKSIKRTPGTNGHILGRTASLLVTLADARHRRERQMHSYCRDRTFPADNCFEQILTRHRHYELRFSDLNSPGASQAPVC